LVVITDPKGNIEYVNEKFIEISGYSRNEVIGKNPRIWKSGHHDKKFYDELWSTLLSGNDYKCEMLNKKNNGELYWEASTISPLLDKKGKITQFVAIKADITEKKKMIEELIKAKEKAEEMNRLKSNFLANMSHELRTPLNGILGYAEVLSSSLEDEEYVKMSRTIHESGTRLSETLNLILDLSKAETEKIDIFAKNISILPIVQKVTKHFSEEAAKKNLQMETVISDENVFANLDANLFERAVSNLVNNAVKFTQSGKITVEVGREQELCYVKIKDTGIGIPEDKIELIWEEFRQVSEGLARRFEGTGLGLTIAKRIIELMGGTITVESKIGVGSVFTVKFSTTTSAAEADQIKNEDESAAQKQKTSQSAVSPFSSILYVEDDLINQNVVKFYLKNLYSVETVRDGISALQLVAEKKYDLILMDINLGGTMNGMAVTKEIRKMSQYLNTPIIAVTAYAMESDKKEFLSGGCSHYLAKPFERNQLLNLITSIEVERKL